MPNYHRLEEFILDSFYHRFEEFTLDRSKFCLKAPLQNRMCLPHFTHTNTHKPYFSFIYVLFCWYWSKNLPPMQCFRPINLYCRLEGVGYYCDMVQKITIFWLTLSLRQKSKQTGAWSWRFFGLWLGCCPMGGSARKRLSSALLAQKVEQKN